MKVLVCGGRDYNNRKALFAALNKIHTKNNITVIVHGGAKGADKLAGEWARENDLIEEVYYADWKRHGRAAGPVRNHLMLKEGKPDFVVAFPGGKGTNNMIALAARYAVPVIEFEWIDPDPEEQSESDT